MAKSSQPEPERSRTRYEYRVWGEHRKARSRLRELAIEVERLDVEDCYLIVDDPSWNAKIRDNVLKIKQLVAEDKGFERWASGWHPTPDAAPSPFDELFEQLRLDRPQRGKSFDLRKAIRRIDPDLGIRPVFVVKHRRRYRVGDLRAEVTDIEIEETDEVLRTLLIEGDELDPLVTGWVYCNVVSTCFELADLRRAREWSDAAVRRK